MNRVVPRSPPPGICRARDRGAVIRRERRPIRPETRALLLAGIARARAWPEELMTGRVISTGALAARKGIIERSVRKTLILAFFAPVARQSGGLRQATRGVRA